MTRLFAVAVASTVNFVTTVGFVGRQPERGFVGRQPELRVLDERLSAARVGQPQIVYVEGEAGAGKSTLLSHFLGSLTDAVVVEVGGDEAETLLSYGIVDQLHPGKFTEPGLDPMAVGVATARPVRSMAGRRASGRRRDRGPSVGRQSVIARRPLCIAQASRRQSHDGCLHSDRCAWTTRLGPVRRRRLSGHPDPDRGIDVRRPHPTGQRSRHGARCRSRAASELAAHTKGNALYCRALLDEIGVEGLSPAASTGLPAPRELSSVILTRVGALPASTQAFLAAAAVLGQHSPTCRR